MKNNYLHIRINEDLKEKLKERAKQENRTLSNYVESLIRKSLLAPVEDNLDILNEDEMPPVGRWLSEEDV